jgi:hypothetical protein
VRLLRARKGNDRYGADSGPSQGHPTRPAFRRFVTFAVLIALGCCRHQAALHRRRGRWRGEDRQVQVAMGPRYLELQLLRLHWRAAAPSSPSRRTTSTTSSSDVPCRDDDLVDAFLSAADVDRIERDRAKELEHRVSLCFSPPGRDALGAWSHPVRQHTGGKVVKWHEGLCETLYSRF